MKNFKIGSWIVTLMAMVAIVGCFVANWNETRIYNPGSTTDAKVNQNR